MRVLALLIAGLAALWFGNSSWLWGGPQGVPQVLAHRGLHQTFHRAGLTGDSCTARMILPPTHGFLENSIPSMAAAFDLGAAVVELDIAPTADGELVVFHDWTLACRTDGTGDVREHPWEYLARLDVGHGYTADNGATWPFRGRGAGLMPRLSDVLEAFPQGPFLVNFKSADAAEGQLLAAYLAARPGAAAAIWGAYGDAAPVAAARAALPGLRGLSRDSLTACLLRYGLTGWSGRVPGACRDTLLFIPGDIAPFLWGWPHLFISRMEAAGSRVVLLGPWRGGGGFSTGIDTPEQAARVPHDPRLLVWTNRGEIVAPLLARLAAADPAEPARP